MKNNIFGLAKIFILLLTSCIIGLIIIFFINVFSHSLYNIPFIKKEVNEVNLIHWTVALTFATIFLGIVAAYQDIIRSWFIKPILDCELDLLPPHCHLFKKHNIFYFRFKIFNNGNISAKKVEVMLIYVKNEKGENIGLSSDNLRWSTQNTDVIESRLLERPRMYWDYISPGTYQYCNLGDIKKPMNYNEEKGNNFGLKFNFSVFWKTPDYNYIVTPGIYTFKIIIGCSNAKAIGIKYKIQIKDYWTEKDDEIKDMFEVLERNIVDDNE